MKQILNISRFAFVAVLLVSTSSCHMYLSAPFKEIKFKKSSEVSLVINDSLYDSGTKKTIYYYPDLTDSIQVTIIEDKKQTTIEVPKTTSRAYVKDRIFTLGIPFDFVLKNTKRYRYPKKMYIETAGDSTYIVPYKNWSQGDISLNIGFPLVNHISTPVPEIGSVGFTGFIGAHIGLQYYLDTNNSIALNTNYKLAHSPTAFLPVFETTIDDLNITSVSATYHYAINRWEYGAGLHYDQLKVTINSSRDIDFKNYISNNLGVHTSLKYRVSYSGYLGIDYIPTFINLKSGGTSSLNHVVSIGYTWRIRLRNRNE